MNKAFIIILVLFVSSPVLSAGPLIGVGKAPCAEVLRINKENPDLAQVTFKSWVIGYIAGKNSALNENRGALGDADSVWEGIITSCVMSPKQNTFTLRDATEQLYTAMKLQEDHLRKQLAH